MKYVIILADGMAGRPLDELGNQTTLQYAHTPVMDELAGKGVIGTVKTVPDKMKPGSDVANLAVMGYDPAAFYSGRSPLEALSVGVNMEDSDVVFRCNIVTLSEEEPYEDKTIIDHSSGEISTEDADILMDAIRQAFNTEEIQFYTGTSYRHITVWNHGKVLDMEAPHDHLGCKAGAYLPEHPLFRDMMERSFEILNNHPLNIQRAKEGKNKANSLWFWGAGVRPKLQNFREKTGLSGGMISAVDLLKGIAVGAGMKVIEVPGANGSLETNYIGKAHAAVNALLRDDLDFVYIHVEAPDEMGHQGNLQNKIKAIENIDSKIVRIVKEQMDASGEDYRMLILPDHPTPICLRTHTSEPVPYILYDSRRQAKRMIRFNEQEAAASGNYQPLGHTLLNTLIEKQ
ncbi:MAG: cofactor-independent phosphoglycerate mutase [Oscillospiraceae bacterium]|nr:cofactor-independent phosphoglycerate mutase [Oscillospiraceae bacterium]